MHYFDRLHKTILLLEKSIINYAYWVLPYNITYYIIGALLNVSQGIWSEIF